MAVSGQRTKRILSAVSVQFDTSFRRDWRSIQHYRECGRLVQLEGGGASDTIDWCSGSTTSSAEYDPTRSLAGQWRAIAILGGAGGYHVITTVASII